MNPANQRNTVAAQIEKRNEFVADLRFIEACIGNIQGGHKKLLRDLKELVYFMSLDKCDENERVELRQFFISYMQGTAAGEEIIRETAKTSRRAKLQNMQFECLLSLCEYDTKNGTTYALFWASLLGRLVSQIAASRKKGTPQQATYWFILNEIGTMVLSRRQPKHFSSGLQPASLEIVLLIDRAVAMMSTPLAIVLTLCDAPGSAPDFISASERLKLISLEHLRMLSQGRGATELSRSVHDDILAWRYNSSFRGRSGRAETAGTAEQEMATAALCDEGVVASLAIFDEVCNTEWAMFAKGFFQRLRVFTLDCK